MHILTQRQALPVHRGCAVSLNPLVSGGPWWVDSAVTSTPGQQAPLVYHLWGEVTEGPQDRQV